MKKASELLKAYLDNVQDARVAAGLFSTDGAIELPYLQTLGYPWRAEGPEEIQKFLENILSLFADFRFHGTKIFIDQVDQVFGEYEVTTTVKETGKVMHQLYMGRLVAVDGKIKLLREGLDTVVTEKAFSVEE